MQHSHKQCNTNSTHVKAHDAVPSMSHSLLADSEKRVHRLLRPSSYGNSSTSPIWSTRPITGCVARSTSLWSPGTASGHCQETESKMAQACHAPWQPLQNYPSRHLWRGVQCHGQQRISWTDNVKDLTSMPRPELLKMASHRKDWKKISAESSVVSPWCQPTHSMWEISPAPAKPLPCLHRLQEGLRQGLACSFVGKHEEVQHQHKPYPSHLWQGH